MVSRQFPNDHVTKAHGEPMESPFELENGTAYQSWRTLKLANAPKTAADLMVKIADLASLTSAEHETILANCARANMSFYDCGTAAGYDCGTATGHDGATTADGQNEIRSKLRAFMSAFGLHALEAHRSANEDGIVALEITDTGPRGGYIPYTNRPLSWHTDGYYNAASERIQAMVLHCVRDAASGGENALLDPELAYIRVRDKSNALIRALTHEQCLTIPANEEKDGTVRPQSIGPVFYVDPVSGALQMRYSARARNIVWRDTDDTRAGAAFLIELVAQGRDVISHRLKPGQGLISNNVLHNRSGFTEHDDGRAGRLYYRSRFQNRIAGT